MKYNYVVLGSNWDLYTISYSDLRNMEGCMYIPGFYPKENGLMHLLFRIHFNPTINKYITLPFKSLWNKTFVEDVKFDDDKPICFIIFGDWPFYETGLIKYLKNHYRDCKVVCFLQDLICTYKTRGNYGIKEPIEAFRYFDLVISFDQGDCDKYGFVYYPLVFSNVDNLYKSEIESDVYFLGLAKNRYDTIIKVYERLTAQGLKCDFHIAGVPEDKRMYKDQIDYSPRMSYTENLMHVSKTRCVLEIMQKGGLGYTQRICEVIGLGKKILTNNTMVVAAPFYNDNYIMTFQAPDDITSRMALKIKKEEVIDYQFKEKLSPKLLIEFIDNKL